VNEPRTIGRYRIYDEIASGGMGTVHFGRMTGAAGFARTVAIKRLHPQFAKEPEFVEGLIDEARVAARIRHPNVVATLDVLAEEGEMLLVMEYVEGVTLSHLIRELSRDGKLVPIPIAIGMITGALYGLHAAHEALGEDGAPLQVVHRDVSPQNIIVGIDGAARVVDFGVAKAVGRLQTTTDGRVKGKIAYMPPEQLRGLAVDRRADVYSAAVVLWEVLAGRRLFKGDSGGETMNAVLTMRVPRVGELRPEVPGAIDDIISKAMGRNLEDRTTSARAMAVALETAVQPAGPREIGDWLVSVSKDTLAERRAIVAAIESATASGRILIPPSSSGSLSKQDSIPTTDAAQIDYSIGFTAHHPPARSKKLGIIVGAALLGTAGVGVGTYAALHKSPPPTPEVAATASTPPPSAEPPIVSVPVVAASIAVVPPPAASSAAPPATHAAPAPKPVKPALNCNPPYTIDATGERHWKKGC
jgi:serine/threonine-protein kinase